MTPLTPSEGEISTSESEKATQTLPSLNGTSVDRHPRKIVTSWRSSRSRSRSRSPYRAPRGEKRRWDGEDNESLFWSGPRSESYRLSNHKRHVDGNGRHHHGTDQRPRKRNYHVRDHEFGRPHAPSRRDFGSRSRSRSPFRHSRHENNADHENSLGPGDHEHDAQTSRNGNRHGIELSVSERSKSSGDALALKSTAKPSDERLLQVKPNEPSGRASERVSTYLSLSHEPEGNSLPPVHSEAALIEEGRKRREALKARYRCQESSLLVQALHQGADDNSSATSSVQTPQRVEQLPVAVLPRPKATWSSVKSAESTCLQTPKDAPPSPTEISFQHGEIMANSNSISAVGGEEEPSAADYDPTVDMQEERARHDKRLFNEEISVSADQERKALESNGDKLPAFIQPVTQNEGDASKEREDRFDMFAEDDEVDIFAEAVPSTLKPSAATDTKTAQSLDVKMMDNWDDPQGYYNTILGELFESRYHVLQNLGRGMFSTVVRATDTKTGKLVAIKIVRSNDAMRKAGIKEIEILKDLAANDPDDRRHMIRLERSFEHKGHLCMVFENLSLNLREVLKKFGRDVGINLKAIRAYAQQLFFGLSLLRKCQYLHADLKPDNILVNDARNLLKICDLGSASSIDENVKAPYLVSRFYRAPEIILGIPYDYGIDVWSIGCTLFELYTGKILFTGRNNNGMLRSIMECRGKFPHKVLRRGSFTYQYFDDMLNFQAIEEDALTGRKVTKMVDIKAKPVKALRERLVPKGKKMDEQERREVDLFADLLDKCMDLRGDKRITPPEALKHPFIARAKP